MNWQEKIHSELLQKTKTAEELIKIASSGNSLSARAAAGAVQNTIESAQKMQAAIQALGPSDSEVTRIINDEIAKNYLGAPLTLAMQQHYLSQFRSYIGQGMSYDQAFNTIASEFGQATENQDIAFYQSRTGINISGGNQVSADQNSPFSPAAIAPSGNVRTAGAPDNNNLLIYGGIALVGLYLLFGNNKGKGLSGVKKTSSRKPVTRTKTKKKTGSSAKGRPAAKAKKKSGRMQVIDL